MEIRTNPAGRKALANLLKGEVAEVGTEAGKFAIEIAQHCDKLYCIDLWKNYAGYRQHVDDNAYEAIFQTAKERLKKYDVSFIRTDSISASKLFLDDFLDAVYIDAAHDYNSIVNDLRAWTVKVKSGGIVAGHDYSGKHGKDVQRAVTEYCEENDIEELVVWEGDKSKSWHFIKP